MFEMDEHEHKIPLPGANVYWAGTSNGTATNPDGYFELKKTGKQKVSLVVSYIGYQNDTLAITPDQIKVEVILVENATLDEVEIAERAPGAHISRSDLIKTSGESIL